MADVKTLDYGKLTTYSIKDRKSLVSKEDFARPWKKGGRLDAFLDRLPSILAGKDIRAVIDALALAAKQKKQICFANCPLDI